MNNDWEHFGEEIKQTIQDAIDTKDYSRLNQMVSDTVNHAMDCVSAGIKNGGWYRDPKTGQPLYGNKKNTGSRSGAENQGYRPNQGPKMSEMRNYSQNCPVPSKISQRNFGKDRRDFSGSDRSCIWIDFCYFPYHHFDWKCDHSV